MTKTTVVTNWNWYGMWLWDYLNLDRDDISAEAWEGFDIWKQAYIRENPNLSGISDLDLIENHYVSAMEPVFNSWLFKAWRLFYLPNMTIQLLIWRCKLYVTSYDSIGNS